MDLINVALPSLPLLLSILPRDGNLLYVLRLREILSGKEIIDVGSVS